MTECLRAELIGFYNGVAGTLVAIVASLTAYGVYSYFTGDHIPF